MLNDVKDVLISFYRKTQDYLGKFEDLTSDKLFDEDRATRENVKQTMLNLSELGEYNWIVVAPDMYISANGKDRAAIDGHFLTYMAEHKDFYDKIKNRILASEVIGRHKHIFEEIFFNIEHENYSVACVAMSSMMDFLLTTLMNYNWSTLGVLTDKFIACSDAPTLNDDYTLSIFGYIKFLEHFMADAGGFMVYLEPQYVNRHWLVHGRMHHVLDAADTYQLLFGLYAFVIIYESDMVRNHHSLYRMQDPETAHI